MNDAQPQTVDQPRTFLEGAVAMHFQPCGSTEEHYVLIQWTRQRFRYVRLGREDKSVGHRYLDRITGYSRQPAFLRAGYQSPRRHGTKTRPTPIAIGERRPPSAAVRPGCIRIDTASPRENSSPPASGSPKPTCYGP